MYRNLVLAAFASLMLAGCAAPGPQLGPPPDPVLSTRAPKPVVPIPRPEPTPPPPAGPQTLRGATIVVDAGHGGHDPGALGRGPVPEKVINLGIALELADRLRERGANVVLTRSSDRFIELDARAATADRVRADLFISLHADSARRSSAQGITVYIGRNASAASRRAAQRVVAAVERAGLESRGVQTAGYRVLVAHSRPAMLVECGFVSNRSEAQRLATPSYRERIAEALADGITAHFSR